MIYKKKLYYLFLIILLTIFIAYGQQNGYEKIAENNNFIMFFNKLDASFEIKDKKLNIVYRTFPKDWENDFSMGITKFTIPSQLVLEFVNEEGITTLYTTYALGVMRGNYEVRKLKDGLRIDYNFPLQGIAISIEFLLKPFGITVRIPIDSIKEPEKIKLNRIWFLPYFLSARKEDKGYLVIPDGSGALVRFDKAYYTERGFELPLYGYDFGLPFYDMPPKIEGIRMPVFGIKKGNTGIVGIIRSGDFETSIATYIPGNGTSYFRVYPIFTYRSIHKFLLYEREASTGQSGEVVDVLVNKISPTSLNRDIIVDYYFLNGENITYSEMAKVVRDYLIENGLLNKKEIKFSFNLSLIGGIKIKTTTLGVPVTKLQPLTTFSEAIKILEELRKNNVENINLIYKGFQPSGYLAKITNGIKFENKLGGLKGFNQLKNYCERNNINLALSAEVIEVHEEGNGFSSARDGNRYLNNGLAFMYKWDPVTKKKNRDYNPWFIVLPSKVPYYLNNFVKDAKKLGIKAIAIENIGDYIYSQNKRPNVLLRSDVINIIKESLDAISKETQLIFTHGNFYVLPYANILLNVPLDNSNYGVETEPIPLYQLIVHGYIPYTGKAGNLRENQKKEFLRMIEYGALPFYEWTYEDSSYFKKSILREMYSSCYRDWIMQAIEEYNLLKDIYEKIVNVPMRSHEKLVEGIYKTSYENNFSVVVNYTQKSFSYKGKVVPPLSFVYFKD